MAKMYFDDDADLAAMTGRRVAVLGYGNQGRSQALNMRDSGLDVVIGSRADSSAEQAREESFEVLPWADAARSAQAIFLLVPDEIMADLYRDEVADSLEAGDMLVFASGYNIFYKFIAAPADVDVALLAPRMIGHGVRTTYVEGQGFPSLVAVEQDGSGEAWPRLLALAKAIGTTRMGAIQSSFEEETVVDLFAEHLGSLYAVRNQFEALVKAGYDPWSVLLEFYASGEMIETQKAYVDRGLWAQMTDHSRTSQYGQEVIAKQSTDDHAAELDHYAGMIEFIRSGDFAKQWKDEQEAGEPVFSAVRQENLDHPMIKAERELYKVLGRRKD